MKTRSKPSAAANQLICRYGRARFYQKPVGRAQWVDENVPMFKPNWVVRFHVGGQTWDESAGPMYPVLDGLAGVKVWAETVMRTKLEAMRAGKLDEMEAVVRPAKVVMLSELLRVYLQNTPPNKPDYAKNAARLRMMMEEASGLEAAEIPVSARWFTADRLREWVRMRQEHFRRGWTMRDGQPMPECLALESEIETVRASGEANLRSLRLRRDVARKAERPRLRAEIQLCRDALKERLQHLQGKLVAVVEARRRLQWEALRADLRANRLPGIDKTEVMECNTTILSYLRCAKAVFANSGEYLPRLVLPDLSEFLKFSVGVQAPEGHREIPEAVLVRILKETPGLQVVSPKVWLFNELAAWTAARPGSIIKLERSALTVNADGTGLVKVPVTKRGDPVLWPVPADVVKVILEVATESRLIGTNGEMTYRASNEWLTGLGLEGTKKISIYRHARLQQMREHGGVEMAAAAGGHKTTAMVQKKYTKAKKAMPMLDPRRVG